MRVIFIFLLTFLTIISDTLKIPPGRIQPSDGIVGTILVDCDEKLQVQYKSFLGVVGGGLIFIQG